MEQVDHALAGMDSGGLAKAPPCRRNDVEHEQLQSDLFFDQLLASFKDESFVKAMADVLSGSVDEPSNPASLCEVLDPALLLDPVAVTEICGPTTGTKYAQVWQQYKTMQATLFEAEALGCSGPRCDDLRQSIHNFLQVLLELKNDVQQVAVEAGNLECVSSIG
eukprot:4806615-Amphidinium_carterae.1